jgi:hypothetical protein
MAFSFFLNSLKGWEYDDKQTLSVDDYEISRLTHRDVSDIEALPPEDRMVRLQTVGYSKEQLRREERRRRVQLVMEYAYRNDAEDSFYLDTCCPNADVLYKRYIS